MKIEDYTLVVSTRGFCDVQEVTGEVEKRIAESGIRSGQLSLFVIGSTAALTTVEYEPGCVQDLRDLFDRLIPPTRDYHHEQTWHDGNGFSHMRAALLKPSLTIPLADGRMRLGTWQQIVVLDFDNKPRQREVALQIMGK